MAATGIKYVYEETTRHGATITFFWRGVVKGKRHPKIQMWYALGTAEFHARYAVLLKMAEVGVYTEIQEEIASLKETKPSDKQIVVEDLPSVDLAKPKTFRWLCEQFFKSPAFKANSSTRTQYTRRRWLELMWDEPIAPGSDKKFGGYPIQGKNALTLTGLEILRDRKVKEETGKRGGVGAANNRVRGLKRVFSWAVKHQQSLGISIHNIAHDLECLIESTDGHYVWKIEQLTKYEDAHPIGTQARLALDLFQYLGVAISDVIKTSPKNVIDDTDDEGNPIKIYRENRTKRIRGKLKGVEFNVGMCPALLESIAKTNMIGEDTYLVTEYGKAYASPNSFGNKFRDWCREAGLPPECTSHGIRKAAATRAAENGATAHQLMALFGWLTLKEAQHYTEQVSRRKLGRAGVKLLAKKS
jgi:integrase